MPPKRVHCSKSQANKKKKNIEKRLLQMSIKVERYVYNKKPISVQDAENYMKEITRYKSQCLQDARCLQVIEKLTRCMKVIIEEHQDLNTDENNTANGHTEIFQDDCPPTSILPDNKLANYDDMQKDIIDLNLKEEVTTIDLTEDDTVNINRGLEQMNVEVEVHRAMSNLSIRDFEDPVPNTSIECSQSILDNSEFNTTSLRTTGTVECFPGTSKVENIKMTGSKDILEVPVDCSQSVLANYEPNNINVSKGIDQFTFRRFKEIQKCTVNFSEKPNAKNNISKPIQQANNKNKLCSPNSMNKVTGVVTANEQNKPIVKRKRITKKKNCCALNNTSENHKQTKVRRKRSSSKEENKDKKIINQSKPNKIQKSVLDKKNTEIDHKKSFMPTGCGQLDTEKSLPSYKIKHAGNTSVKNTTEVQNMKVLALIPDTNNTISIYNRTTENDLSWIENIRYVREVPTDEFDMQFKDLKDDFWHNFDLPNNWDDKEFTYTV